MLSVKIGILYYLCKLGFNMIIVFIGVIKNLSPLYFYNILKDNYYENTIIFSIMMVLILFLLYPYIIMMAIIRIFIH